MKIIAFGSRLKGDAHSGSDLDVLVLTSRTNGIAQLISGLAFDIQMNERVGLEPVIASIDELFPLRSYFLFSVIRSGAEVFSVPDSVLKREERKNLVDLAEEYLAGAELAQSNGHWRLATDAAYNAAELATKSLILRYDDELPASPGGLVGRFGELYVKTERLEKEIGRRLNRALLARNQARYKLDARVGKEDAEAALALARELKELAAREL